MAAPQFESISFSLLSLLYGPTLIFMDDYWKNHRFDYIDLWQQSKCLLISWLQSLSTVILKPKKIKSFTVSIVSPSICHEVMRPDAMILVFFMLSFKPAFSLSSFTLIKRLFGSFCFLLLEWYHLYIWGYWYFSMRWSHVNERKEEVVELPLINHCWYFVFLHHPDAYHLSHHDPLQCSHRVPDACAKRP